MNKLRLTRNILTGTLLIVIGVIAGMLISNHMKSVKADTKPTVAVQQEQSNNQPVRLVKVLTESTEDIKLDEGKETYRELSDGSYSLENSFTKEYTFQPTCMGDWDLKADSKEELNNMISTYIENTNNLNKKIKKPLRITKVLTESTDEVRISKDEIYTEYSTNAWTIEDNKNNKYELSIPELGDYTYIFNNRKDFDNCLQTYIDNYNNGENLSI
ncbi:hypothetical protein ACRTAL_002390 [Clostridium perfringens]